MVRGGGWGRRGWRRGRRAGGWLQRLRRIKRCEALRLWWWSKTAGRAGAAVERQGTRGWLGGNAYLKTNRCVFFKLKGVGKPGPQKEVAVKVAINVSKQIGRT